MFLSLFLIPGPSPPTSSGQLEKLVKEFNKSLSKEFHSDVFRFVDETTTLQIRWTPKSIRRINFELGLEDEAS